MVITVIGAGKLGAPIVACFAARGHRVFAVDRDPRVISRLNEGLSPVYEPEVEDLLQKGRANITATHDVEASVAESDVSFVLVPTPSDSEGGFSLQYVLEACAPIGAALRKSTRFQVISLTSTVSPGSTGREVRSELEKISGKKCGVDFGLCYSPEFVALGSVVRDFLQPDFLLIGESDPRSGDLLVELYRSVCANDPPIARMNFVNAELTKLAVNTFVTTKISFANMLARICEQLPEANVDAVTSALGLDSRIGARYLKGAIGYGGPCFPRDNMAMGTLAKKYGITANIAEATDRQNRAEIKSLSNLVKSKLPANGTVGILGLTYKPDTNVVEESQGLLLSQALCAENVNVAVYDPAGIDNARRSLPASVKFCESMNDCIRESDVLVITTPWPEFRELQPSLLTEDHRSRILIDCWRLLDRRKFEDPERFIQLGVGARD